MRVNFILKGKLMLALFLFSLLSLDVFAANFMLNNDVALNEKAIEKINQIGTELNSKTGVNVFVYAKDSFGFDPKLSMDEKIKIIKTIENNATASLGGSYAALFISLEDIHVNLIMSDDIKTIVDKDEILDDYVVPLLASKDKNSLNSKVSAAALNGYAEITDRIAISKGTTLESSIGSGGTQASSIWKVFMYTMIVGGLLAYMYAVFRSKKNG